MQPLPPKCSVAFDVRLRHPSTVVPVVDPTPPQGGWGAVFRRATAAHGHRGPWPSRTGNYDHDQFAADVAFGAVRRGRWVAADVGVRELAGSPVGTLLSGCAAAGLVALMRRIPMPAALPAPGLQRRPDRRGAR